MPASVGRFEGDALRAGGLEARVPEPRVPEHAARRTRSGARGSCRGSPPTTSRAIVAKGEYSDPAATAYVTKVLVERQRKVLATWLNGVTPLVDPVLSADGVLRATNAAVAAGVADAPRRYTAQWFALDNAAGTRPSPSVAVVELAGPADLTLPLPVALASRPAGEYIGVTVTGEHPAHPAWAEHPVTFSFRRTRRRLGDRWASARHGATGGVR